MAQLREDNFLNPDRVVVDIGVRDGMCVADFGCGSGAFSLASARVVGPHGEVWAIDADRQMLSRLVSMARAENLENRLHILTRDVEKREGSGLPDDFVDIVIAANILFSTDDKEMLAKEVYRVLKGEINGAFGYVGKVLLIDWEDSFNGVGPPHECIVNKHDAREIFERAGFSFVQDVPAGSHHWGMIMRK